MNGFDKFMVAATVISLVVIGIALLLSELHIINRRYIDTELSEEGADDLQEARRVLNSMFSGEETEMESGLNPESEGEESNPMNENGTSFK